MTHVTPETPEHLYRKSLGIAGASLLQAAWSSCHRTSSDLWK